MAPRLLLIEDSVTIQEEVQRALASSGIDVAVATDAVEGLAKLHALAPDLVLADAALPELDGIQLCRLIRSQARFHALPVVLLTSSLTAYDATRGHQAGVTAHLNKPFTAEELRQTVHRLLASGGAESAGQPLPLAPAAGAAAERELWQAVGRQVVQSIRDAVYAQVAGAVAQALPQLVQAVQETVVARLPEVLEVVLQREIERLKRAVAQEDSEGESIGGTAGPCEGL